jgi:hypothetical protein
MTASAAAHAPTLRAIGPIESSVYERGNAPSVGTRDLVGLYPTTPQSAAGTRVEPPVSEPIAISHMPSAGYSLYVAQALPAFLSGGLVYRVIRSGVELTAGRPPGRECQS